MGDDLRSDAVLERSDDLRGPCSPRGWREQRAPRPVQADRVAFDLDIPPLHDVEQAHWIFPARSGSSLNREDAPVRPGQGPKCIVSSSDSSDRAPPLMGSTSADDVGDGESAWRAFSTKRTAGSQAIGVPAPCSGHELAPELRDRRERVVVHLAPARIGISSSSSVTSWRGCGSFACPAGQQDEVVARQDGVHELRDDRLL